MNQPQPLANHSVFEEIKSKLILRIRYAYDESLFSEKIIHRIEFEIPSANVFSWLTMQKEDSKVFWSNRDGGFEASGIGIAYAIHGTRMIDYEAVFHELNRYLNSDNKNIKFYGGFAFAEDSIDAAWNEFGTYRFVLPRFELSRKDKSFSLACHLFGDPNNRQRLEEIIAQAKSLSFEPAGEPRKLTSANSRSDEPTLPKWKARIEESLKEIVSGHFKKVVLARRSAFQFDEKIDPLELINHLQTHSDGCFHFYLQPQGTSAFLGATPERLYRRVGRKIFTEAVAGTRARGKTSSDDIKNKQNLLNSQKDKREHLFVAESIQDGLTPLCKELKIEKSLEPLALVSGHHLLTTFSGTLVKDVSDADIINMLHPTPATGGWPTDRALAFITKTEQFKRGWYAGPIGYIGHNECEFAVGLRCGLVSEKTLFLYAGAGIVEGSSAQNEWEEIETKIGNFLRIFEK